MNRRPRTIALVASALLLGAAAGTEAPMPSVALPDDFARVLADYETAWRGHDAAALAALFTEDGFVLSNEAPPVRGRDAIRRQYAGAGGPLVLRAYAFGADGSTGYILGGFGHAAGGPDTGKFTLVLRRDASGRWLIVSDMDNRIRPRG